MTTLREDRCNIARKSAPVKDGAQVISTKTYHMKKNERQM